MTFQVGDRVTVVNNDASEWGAFGDIGTVVSVTPPRHLYRDYDIAVEFDAPVADGHSLDGLVQNGRGLWLYASQLALLEEAANGSRATSFAEFIRKQERIRSAL